MSQICNPCAENPVCLDFPDRYNLQEDVYYFVLNCLPGFYCGGNNVIFLVCCDGTIMQQVLPQGITAAQREAYISELIASCFRKIAFCDDGGSGTVTPNVPNDGTDVNNPVPLYANRPQPYTVSCPGGQPFTYTVPAGLFIARTQELADAAARNYARTLANDRKICLSSPRPYSCNNVAYSSTVVASGGVGSFRWAIIGSLPTGLVAVPIGNNGLRISGIPTVNGHYNFTIRAVDSLGDYAQKTVTIIVWGITDSTLPNGALAADYDYQLTTTFGISPYNYLLVSGGFPLGIDLTTGGLITGVAGEEGVFNPVIRVIDSSGKTCTKAFTLTVPAAPTYRILYWTMEETGLANRIDKVSSLSMPVGAEYTEVVDVSGPGAIGIDGDTGLFGNGFRIAKGLNNTWAFGAVQTTEANFALLFTDVLLRQDGAGFSFCFWMKVDLLNTVVGIIDYSRTPFFRTQLRWTNASCVLRCTDNASVHFEDVALPIPSAGVWTFYEFYHDPVAGKMGAVINNTVDYPTSFTPTINASPNGSFQIIHNGFPGAFTGTGDATDAQDFTVDEVLIRMDARLTVAQRAYIYNAGVGRTWPIVLP